eukprot:gene9363-1574_t
MGDIEIQTQTNLFPLKAQWKKKQFILNEDSIVIKDENSDKESCRISVTNETLLHGSKVGKNLKKKYRFKLVEKKQDYLFETDSIITYNIWRDAFKKLELHGSENLNVVKPRNDSFAFLVSGGVCGEDSVENITSMQSVEDEVISITTHDVTQWETHHVKKWLEGVLFFEKKETVNQTVQIFKSVNGNDLLTMDYDTIQGIGVQDIRIIGIILQNIAVINEMRVFNFAKFAIANKVHKSVQTAPQLKNRKLKLRQVLEIVDNLSSAKSLKASYLNPKSRNVKKLLDIMEANVLGGSTLEEDTLERKSDKDLRPGEEVISVITEDVNMKEETVDKPTNKEPMLKVKIVITSTEHITDKTRKIVSPLVNPIKNINSQFGLFHTALIIGPYYLDWTEQELVIPKTVMKSKRSFMSIDVTEIPVKNIDEIVDSLADVISEWNVYYKYSQMNGDRRGNCQDFVDAIFEKLNIKYEPKGILAEYLKIIRNKGKSTPIFSPDDDFKKKFKTEEIEFKSHKEVDKYVLDLLKIDPDFENSYPDEYKLLKSFDRGFWLREFDELAKMKDKHKIREYLDEEKSCCFKDPRRTGSFIAPKE